jgi:branched-chain amino acid transport system permease protein
MSDRPPDPPDGPDWVEDDAGPSRAGGSLATDVEELPERRSIAEYMRGAYQDLTRPVRGATRAIGNRYLALPGWGRALVTVALVGLVVALPAILPYVSGRPNYWVAIALRVGVAAILALGLNVVVGFAGLLDLGYVAFFAIGAYTYAIMSGSVRFTLASRTDLPADQVIALKPEFHMYFWLILFAALAVAALAGVILGGPTLRLRGDYLAIVTLGFGEIVRIVSQNLRDLTGGPLGVVSLPHPAIDIGPIKYEFGLANEAYFWLCLGFIAIIVFFVRRLNDSRVGRAWAAIREDELAAAAMGVPTVRMKLWAFIIGAGIGATGGVIYAMQISFINPGIATLLNPSFGSIIVLAMVVLGGMGGIWGPIVGAAVMIALPEIMRTLGDARFVIFGLALVLIMIFRPQGLIPSRRRAAELTGGEVREGSVYEIQQEAAP